MRPYLNLLLHINGPLELHIDMFLLIAQNEISGESIIKIILYFCSFQQILEIC